MTGDPQPGVVGEHLFRAAIGDLLPGREPPDGGRNLHVEIVRGMQRARCGQSLPQLYRPYGATFSLDRCYDLAIHHDQITHWRDYLDPIAVFDAIGWPDGHG
jgi:hypothetical protein